MELRSRKWARFAPGRAVSLVVASVARTLCVCAVMALLLAHGGTVRAQEAATPPGATEPAASEPAPSGQEAQTPSASDELPPVIVETDAPAAQPTGTGTGTAVSQPSSPPSQPATILEPGDPTGGEAGSVIFAAPELGDTLNRGTTGVDGYFAEGTSLATKTNTSIMNIPGSVSVITQQLAADQGATWLGQALHYVPGIAVQQGEGHRDHITFRGQETNADFFVDGVRDDVQTFRDLYNAESIEVLKGPMAMIFGRGGGGGVINRVTKRADGVPVYEGSIEFGRYDRTRFTADVGQAVTDDFAVRLNAMWEDSETFRDYSWLERYGINPTAAVKLGDKTTLHMSYEYKVHDQNVDRGGPSINGRPFEYPIETFFGQPFASFTEFDGHIATATFQHETQSGVQIRNHTFYADYYKLYQNIFTDSEVDPGTELVALNGYLSLTERQNFVNQTDVSYSFRSGPWMRHTLVAGTEVVVQDNFEIRRLPQGFPVNVDSADPTIFTPVIFNDLTRQRQTDLTTLSAFVQDQIEITPYFEIIGGVRFEHFDVEFADPAASGGPVNTSRIDNVWSPRVGAVIKPTEQFHVYASFSKSFLPQNGDNFGNFAPDTARLKPEEFVNYETGFKWRLAPRLMLTGAVFQLDRENQPVSIGGEDFATGSTRTNGAEIEINGYVTDDWQIFGGYAYTDSEIKDRGDATDLVGNRVEVTPRHMFSMWNKYQVNRIWGVGLGVIHQSAWFPEANNSVKVPGYTRVDGAVFLNIDETWSAQLNVENIFDNTYWISSHNNDNISYGSPRAAYVTIRAKM